ncbi:TPA: hypothetical protein GDC93_06795 [Legionella pneumophila]|uniref:Antibiotic biosynthesis monooxygenase n=2 Tax=Legionella pneumophila TaxID=446 RepID=A0AAN5TAC4_LEGPN|nr:hypothetical protein DI137_06805 [Legionella pneumophila]BCZ97590.1 hypothetical protein LEG80045_18460 [Legionella pneumophila]HAT7004311.1 hypothetical protein [Legionella pneumophila]HAT7742987.1 hypothetical protein [Legionella pneumophila]HAT7939493.1 hypothetical protein [Legionella pneumophila]
MGKRYMNKVKAKIIAFTTVMLFLTSINIHAKGETPMKQYHQINEATMITMKSKLPNSSEFEKFLESGGQLVKQTEPDTKVWFALKGNDNSLMIFDAFYDSKGREAHFAGQVAKALKNNSEQLVLEGWENGVLKNIVNSKVLASKLPARAVPVTLANYIEFTANDGKSEQLAALLSNAAEIVDKTEPQTAYWFALQMNDNTFAIFDAFSDESGQKAHFSGKVALSLKNHSELLIKNGWEKGVLPHIKSLKVITNI